MSNRDTLGSSPLEVANPVNKIEESYSDEELNKTFRESIPEKEKSDLEKEKIRIGTRSQVDIEHKELKFERKPKMSNTNVVIRLEEAVKLIPKCTGEDDIYQFTNACDLAIESVEEKNVPILIKYITTRLSGKALEAIKYKDTSKWIYIKKYLTDTFEVQHSISSLQLELNSAKMRFNEDVNTYSDRVEKLYYKLSDMNTLNKNKDDARVIHEALKDQTLAIYMKGLKEPIRTIVKSRNPKTLEHAKQIARSEELEFNSDKEALNNINRNKHFNNQNNYDRSYKQNFNPSRNKNRNFNRNNYNSRPTYNNQNNKPPIKCYNCNGNHFASQCRNNSQNYGNNNRPPNQNNFTRPSTNYNVRFIACEYCNKNGHNINECYKKRYNDRNNRNNGNNNNSGNAQVSDMVSGTRSINQITTADVFTSQQD